MSQLTLALLITAIGMGLVFAALIILALMMQALVALTARPVKRSPVSAVPDPQPTESASLLHKAAAISVALALTEAASQGSFSTPTPEPGISAWQSVQRAAYTQRQGKMR
ncbi:MAG: OadG family protein [Anaerolineales bacterium]|nr:OadG family protein [Anaerolineales bacterium]